MEVAVADVTEDRRSQTARLDILLRFQNALRKPRDGDAGIGGECGGAWAEGEGRVIGVVARLPEARSLLRQCRPLIRAATELIAHRLHRFGLLLDRCGRPVEFKEQGRCRGESLEL